MSKATKKDKKKEAPPEKIEPIKLFGAVLDIESPDDLTPFIFMAAQEAFSKLGTVSNATFAVLMGASLTHHPAVSKTIHTYQDAKQLTTEEQTELVAAGAALTQMFARRMEQTKDEAEGEGTEDDSGPKDLVAESGEPTS